MMQNMVRLIGRMAVAVVGLVVGSPMAMAAASGADDAGNYEAGAFINGANLGTGFGAWEFNVGVSAMVDLGDSTTGTGNINSTNDRSFMFYGGTNGSYAEAIRPFNAPLAVGDTISATIAYNWGGGARGLNLLDASNGELMNVNFSDDNLSYGFANQAGGVADSTYISTAAVVVVVEQLAGNQLLLTLTRNDGFTTNYTSTALTTPAAKIKFYNGGHAGDNVNYALFANALVLTANPDPTLNLNGRDAMAVGMTNQLVLTRGGTNLIPVTINLISSDAGVVAIDATADFALGETVTNVSVEGISPGIATLIATNLIFPDAFYDVTVYDYGYDDTAYAAGQFTNGGNSGLGFQPWILQNNDGAGEGFTNFAGAFIGDSTFGGSDVNSSSGDAFALYANGQGGGNAFANAIRPFNSELAVGQVISLEIGVNFRNGSKGVAFQNSGNGIFEVGVFADDYWYKIGNGSPISLGWDYASDSAIQIEFARVAGNLYNINIIRNGSAPETFGLTAVDLGGSAPNEVRFFNFNTDSGDNANNLYFNRLALFAGPELVVLTITGNDGMVVNQTNSFTVTRTGATDAELVVDLASSDEAVFTVPASVEIAIGETSATFDVVALSNGVATVSASAIDVINDDFDFEVVDIAYDDTTYYPPASFDNAGNGGIGFATWVISANDGPGEGFTNFVGAFLGDSTLGGSDVNSSDNTAFGLYANGDGTDSNAPLAEATRAFTELAVGQSISVDIGVNFRNGAKGIMFQNGATWLLEVGVFNDDYVYNVRDQGDNPVSLGWDYASDSAITVILSRTGPTSYNVNFIRSGSAPENTLVQGVTMSLAPDRARFYVFDTDSGDANNNLYINDLAIYTGVVGELITDGIPNSWWDLYSIPALDRVAAADFDLDDYSNLDEYIADTNPNDINSFFPNAITDASGGNVMSLQTGPTTNSRVYDIWWTTNLLAAPQQWTRLGVTTTGNGGTLSLSVTNDVPSRVYRTGVALP
jgi:hypothetical protein